MLAKLATSVRACMEEDGDLNFIEHHLYGSMMEKNKMSTSVVERKYFKKKEILASLNN